MPDAYYVTVQVTPMWEDATGDHYTTQVQRATRTQGMVMGDPDALHATLTHLMNDMGRQLAEKLAEDT